MKHSEEIIKLNNELADVKVVLIAQEHRLLRVLHNFFILSPKLNDDDPRRNAAKKALIWYFLAPGKVAGVGISIVAIIGVILAYHANLLLETQNNKIEIQNQLAESSRRAALIFELTSINESIHAMKNIRDGQNKLTLDSNMRGRIVALSRSLKPYRYLNYRNKNELKSSASVINSIGNAILDKDIDSQNYYSTLTERVLSPERGQLLVTLINAKIANFDLLLKEGADFSFADLKGVNLSGFDLSGANLTAASLEDCMCLGTKFTNAFLMGATFKGAFIVNANFDGASLIQADFSLAHASATSFDKRAELQGAVFVDADLEHATFGDSDDIAERPILVDADFTGTNLKFTNFIGSVLKNNSFRNSLIERIRFENVNMNSASFQGAFVTYPIIVDSDNDTSKSELRRIIETKVNLSKLGLSDSEWNPVIKKHKNYGRVIALDLSK